MVSSAHVPTERPVWGVCIASCLCKSAYMRQGMPTRSRGYLEQSTVRLSGAKVCKVACTRIPLFPLWQTDLAYCALGCLCWYAGILLWYCAVHCCISQVTAVPCLPACLDPPHHLLLHRAKSMAGSRQCPELTWRTGWLHPQTRGRWCPGPSGRSAPGCAAAPPCTRRHHR